MPDFLPSLMNLFRAPEAKASRTAKVLAFESGGRARWTPRDYAALAREGYLTNAIVHRAVRLIAENAASCGFLIYEGAAEREAHPLSQLLTKPNARQDGASFFEAVYAHMLLAGNAYVEAVALGEEVRELHALRPDRMKVVPGHDGWPEAYEYSVAGRSVRFDQLASNVPPILHLTFFHPLDDHYGLAPIEAAAVAVDAVAQIGVLNRDRTLPPLTPAEGDRHIVASGATGAWAGQADAVAVFEDGAWRFLNPKLGWCAWCDAEGALLVYDGAAWTDVASGGGGSVESVSLLGVNDTASSPNLLTVKSNAALFNAIAAADGGTGDMRLQISKESSAKTASVVFSDAFSGRAEFGLVGSDAFKLKVSNDGSAFVEALAIDQSSGNTTLPRGLALTGVISPSQITSNQNDYNPTGIASASVLNLSSDASRSVSGLASGAEGRVVGILNTGSQTILLLNESASSTAANRFALGGDIAIAAKQAALLRYDGTASRWYAIARPVGRYTLTANRTYYVRTDGSNNNDGLSNAAGGAFLTIQKAIDIVAALDISIYTVTIQLVSTASPSTFTGGCVVTGPWVGSGSVVLAGDATTPANTIISAATWGVLVQNGGRLHVRNFKIQTSAVSGISAQTGGQIKNLGGIEFGACSFAHWDARDQGIISCDYGTGAYKISGGAQAHFYASTGGQYSMRATTITLTGTPAFILGFAYLESLSIGQLDGLTFSGSATGPRYSLGTNSVIQTYGAGASYFPGNSAGSVGTGGQYL